MIAISNRIASAADGLCSGTTCIHPTNQRADFRRFSIVEQDAREDVSTSALDYDVLTDGRNRLGRQG
jgi:hypothetical protein